MNNVVVLYKTEEGYLYCRQITEEGKKFLEMMEAGVTTDGPSYWEDGGTILLEELMEILDREI